MGICEKCGTSLPVRSYLPGRRRKYCTNCSTKLANKKGLTQLELLAINYIVAREQYTVKQLEEEDAGTLNLLGGSEILHIYEMDMFKHLVNLANHVKFERPEFKELMGID